MNDKEFAEQFAQVAMQYRDGCISAIEAITAMAILIREDDMTYIEATQRNPDKLLR